MDSEISKKSARWIIFGIVLLSFLATGALVLFRNKIDENILQPKTDMRSTTALPGIEVREYQGEKLSSVDDVVNQGIKGVQNVDINSYLLAIAGLVGEPKEFSYSQVLELPKYSKVVSLYCVEGWDAKILWEGVLVKDLIEPSGVKPEANTVIFYATDGYTTSLPLDYIEKNNILLASKMNDLVLSPAKGFPFQLVAEDKWGYKWIKWVTKIELSNDPEYRGYWESRGYNNNGDLSGPQRESH